MASITSALGLFAFMLTIGCSPRVSSETRGGDDTVDTSASSTGDPTENDGTTSSEPRSQEDWIAHCASLQTAEACAAQRAEFNGTTGICEWLEWREVLDEEACMFSEVVVADCSAYFFGGDTGPSSICLSGAGIFPCRRDDLGFPAVSATKVLSCGRYEWCVSGDPVCECACDFVEE